ncbi:MAG: LCP family protein [Christensenellales bacterium]|jgi:LCP family protein required for cell wall assembly
MRRRILMSDNMQMQMPDNGGNSGGGLADGEPESPKPSDKPKKAWSTRKTVIVAVAGALALILISVAAWVWSILNDPLAQFSNVAEQFSPPASASAEPDPGAGEPDEPDATPTPDPYEVLLSQADTSFLKDIVNIMLIGVDHAAERDTEEWARRGGKQSFHADVMIVLAINKNTGEVNMISLPRDTYAQIPVVKGIYKLNASLDCGGGWPSEANGYSTSGFDKVCEAASWMLGGIPVKYYYAVDMNAVKGLVDAIGGVQNFEIEDDFTMQGRSYKKGVQPHMDGQAVLDYLRVRKKISESGDLNRINRQKKMLVAIFDKIQKNGLLASIPSLLHSFDGNLYTNTTLAQTAALAAFAYNVNPDSIGMHSMGGRYNYGIFNWNFVLTDQQARVKLIKQIYGVDVEPYKDYTASAAIARWNKMQLPVVKKQAAAVLDKVKAKLDADAQLPIEGATPTPAPPVQTPAPPPKSEPPAEPTPPADTSEPPADTSEPPAETPDTSADSGAQSGASGMALLRMDMGSMPRFAAASTKYRKYLPGGREWSLYYKARNELNNLTADTQKIQQLKADIETLCPIFGIPRPSWRVNYETTYNEIHVDFR